jgi:hypothetical protein
MDLAKCHIDHHPYLVILFVDFQSHLYVAIFRGKQALGGKVFHI